MPVLLFGYHAGLDKIESKSLNMDQPFDFQHTLPGDPLSVHPVLGNSLLPPFSEQLEVAVFGMGCFWGAERKFWVLPGVYTTAAGYAGGHVEHPTYHQVCRGNTGHAEAVLVVYAPEKITYQALLQVFWESHDPTQGMRQGNDIGTQYRSLIMTYTSTQLAAARHSQSVYQRQLRLHGHQQPITSEISMAGCFHYADSSHQQYLAKNPNGYCGLGGAGVCYPAD